MPRSTTSSSGVARRRPMPAVPEDAMEMHLQLENENRAMSEKKYKSNDNWEWVDICGNPDYRITEYVTYLEGLGEKYNIHPATIKDCLTPFHLPKAETIGDLSVFILRYVKPHFATDADTMPELTNKLVMMFSPRFIITIHRYSLELTTEFIQSAEIARKWDGRSTKDKIINTFFDDVLSSFKQPMEHYQHTIDELELAISSATKDITPKIYLVRRQLAVFVRVIHLTRDVVTRYLRINVPGTRRNAPKGGGIKYSRAETTTHDAENPGSPPASSSHPHAAPFNSDPFRQDIKDFVDSVQFELDLLHENTTDLLNLHIALASNRTNRYVHVLAIFTAFFVPVSFLAGLWGMNFRNMPELHYKWGYPMALGSMIASWIITAFMLKFLGIWKSNDRHTLVDDEDDVL